MLKTSDVNMNAKLTKLSTSSQNTGCTSAGRIDTPAVGGAGRRVSGTGGFAVAEQQVWDAGDERQLDHRQDLQRVSPSVGVDEERGQWDEHGAGQAAEQGDDDDRFAIVGAEHPGDDGERGVVERHRRDDADPDADRVELPQLGDVSPREQQRRAGERGDGHHPPPAVAVDPPTPGVGAQAGDGEHDGEGAADLCLGPAELGGHRVGERYEDVVEAAPRDDLPNAEGADEWIRKPARRRRGVDPGAHQPQQAAGAGGTVTNPLTVANGSWTSVPCSSAMPGP